MYYSDRRQVRIQDFDKRAKALIYCQDPALGIPPDDHTLQFSGIRLIHMYHQAIVKKCMKNKAGKNILVKSTCTMRVVKASLRKKENLIRSPRWPILEPNAPTVHTSLISSQAKLILFDRLLPFRVNFI